jgi:hypothetical protein
MSPARAVFDATARAGTAITLADRIRRYTILDYAQMKQFAKLAGITESELRLAVMPLLKDAGIIDYSAGPTGEPGRVTEQVGVSAPLLVQCDALWEACSPSEEEAAAVQSAELGALAPMAIADHQNALERAGFREAIHDSAIRASVGAGLLYRQPSLKLGEDVLFSPYVWSTAAINIADFLKNLPPNERELLMSVSGRAIQRPGISEDQLPVPDKLLRGARRAGLIDATRVQTATNDERSFVFSPALERQLAGGSTEVTHHRKLFTAHILYGHRYGSPGTGRIDYPIALVRRLINDRTVRPSTAARTDYLLLEAAGIVRVEKKGRMGQIHLVKDDVAQDSLDLLRVALAGEGEEDPAHDLWLPGSSAGFVTPERDRAALPEIGPGAEAEVLESAVEELRSELERKFRGEEF